MTLFQSILLGVAPALLAAAAWAAFRAIPAQQKSRRWLAGALLAGLVLVPLIGLVRQTAVMAFVLAPAAIGLLALVWTQQKIPPRWRVWLLPAGLAVGVLVGVSFYVQAASSLGVLLGNALALGGAWLAVKGGWSKALAVSAAAIGLAVLGSDAWIGGLLPQMPRYLGVVAGVVLYFIPGWVTALAAGLIAAGLGAGALSTGSKNVAVRPWKIWLQAAVHALLALGLLGWLGWLIYWTAAWYQTSDGVGGVSLVTPAGLTALAAGMFLALFAPFERLAWRWLLGAGYAALAPLFLFQVFYQGFQMDYHALTRQRADQVAQTLEAYRQQEGEYPQSLEALAPQGAAALPQPFILRGETWCYQGGGDAYRLGALYREYFSSPLEVRVYASQGALPEGGWECDARLETYLREHGQAP